MSLDYKSIGKRIRLIRHRRQISQAMLSELIDKTPSYISYIENGFKSMSLEAFVLIANTLRVSPTQLLIEQLTCTEIYKIPVKVIFFIIKATFCGSKQTNGYIQSHLIFSLGFIIFCK